MKQKWDKRKRQNRRRFLSIVLVFAMLFNVVPFSDLGLDLSKKLGVIKEVHAATYSFANGINEYDTSLSGTSYTINILQDDELKKFSSWYYTYASNLSGYTFNLNLQKNTQGNAPFFNLYGTSSDGYDFLGFGTESCPFYGSITIPSGNVNVFYSPVPLFDCIDQRTIITFASTSNEIGIICGLLVDDTNSNLYPCLAKSIVNPNDSATPFSCSVKLSCFDGITYENSEAKDFAGLIGEIGTASQSASASISLTNNAKDGTEIANVQNSAGLVGLFCQKINAESTLNATINSGSNNSYTVNATSSYNAGGLVGEMASGATLSVSGAGLNGVTQTVTGNYAGGIVGYAEDAYVDSETTDSDSSMTITSAFKTSSTSLEGTSGSGYLFGCYKNSSASARTITLSSFNGLSVSSTNGNSGGLIGVLEHKPSTSGATFTIDGRAGVSLGANITQNLTIGLPNGTANCGGLIGYYTTDSLSNTLNVTNVYAKITNGNQATTGGIIGKVDDSSSAAYISMSKIYAHRTNNSATGGGLIGTAGGTNTKGVFLNVSGYNKVQGQFAGGLVNTINYGVVRIEGITDLGNLTAGNYIVSTRDSALIYSPGSGNQTGTSVGEWRLIRESHVSDDIGSWGEVVRVNGFNANSVINETSFVSNHYVSINNAVTTNISTVQDLTLLALNIQHNTNKTSAALVLSDTTNTSSSLLESTANISLASDQTISLSGTGITGLTRDNSDQTFKGSFNGNDSAITLAIGEAYGVNSSGTAVSNNTSSNAGTGRIYSHGYNGLFSKTNGARISNLTVSGTQWLGLNALMFFGGVSAQSEGGDSFNNVNSSVTVNVKRQGDNVRITAGGFVGRTNTSASGSITFESCSTTASFSDDTWQAADKAESHFGGYIGLVDAHGGSDTNENNSLTISFGTSGGTDSCAVGGSYSTESSTAPLNSIYGGLIGTVRGNNSHAIYNGSETAFRTINAYGVTVDGISINSKTNTASGGLLGYAWHDAEVNLQNVTVGGTSASTVAISGGTGTKLAGLVYDATGHWTVGTVSIDKVAFTASNASSSLGLLVNSTVNECRLNIDNTTTSGYAQDKKAGLLLEITNQANYTVDSTSGLSIDSKVTVFDEIAAFSKNPDKDIADNGNSIISINTDGDGTGVVMTGSSCNTYQNQSSYGKNTVTVNPNTRYYYNLDTIRTKESPSDAEKVLLWSVNKYAHGTAVKSFFYSWGSISIDGNLDMDGLSYYPIDAAKNISTVSKLKFYNYEIETAEGLTGNGNTDGITRSTTSISAKSQHYMMHCGLFRNVSGGTSDKTVSVGNITLEGNVGIIESGSGFLVCGTLGGGTGVTTFGNGSSNTITLNGAYVNGASDSSAASMLIANVDSNTILNINGVKSQNYSSVQADKGASWYAATSLIGAVGKTDGSSKNMKVNFSKIVLDSRKQNITDADNTRLSAVYGSSRTIFKTATLLGHYYYDTSTDTDSEGVYNYTHDEDWGTETVGESQVAKHQVTYGTEISSSQEYDGKQEKYYGSSYYTDPTLGTNASSEYSFSTSNFIPYVGSYYNEDSNYHELKVNHSVVSLTNGCGTYNDPYVVDGGMLGTVSSILNGTNPDSTIEICLPDSGLVNKTSTEVNAGVGDINLLWCTGSDFHHNYHWNGSAYSNADGSKSYSKELVQAYLAGAYYEIDKDIEIETGLSGILNYTAFRGVVVGKKFIDDNEIERYPNVTLSSASPFIPTSNGCVIKNLNFVTNANVTLYQLIANNTAPAVFDYNGGCMSYGVVIGKIMGGDNVIDNVGVTYNGTITSSTNAYIVPTGGYVGVVVNGGLFFRNMDLVPAAKKTGLTDSNFSGGNHIGDSYTAFLYHNPIIGRVINGYAVTEATSYVPGAGSQTMKNGVKNYAITDINKNESVGGTGASNILDVQSSTITVPTAQAWFLMSCIVNSGTGSGTSTNYQMADDNISYSVTNYKTTHIGSYADVGDNTKTTSTVCDSLLFKTSTDAYSEMGNSVIVTPYIIEKYTSQSGNGTNDFYKHYAKSIYKGSHSITMGASGTAAEWFLPDSYRGIGIFNKISTETSPLYNINVSSMTCNDTTINLNMKYQTYLYSTTNNIKQENYYPSNFGFGLFNTFIPSQALTVSNLTLKGNVYVDTLDKATGVPKHIYGSKNNYQAYNKTYDDIVETNNATNGRVSSGMFAGMKSSNSALTLSNIELNTISVHSSKTAGGLIGTAKNVTISDCPATNVSVEGKWDTGGYIGAINGNVTIVGNSTDKTEFKINTIVITGVGYNERENGRPGAVGGLIGRQYNASTVSVSNMKLTKYDSYGIVKNYQDQNDISSDETPVGGIVGAAHRSNLSVSNCEVNGITVYGDYSDAGGVLGCVQHNTNDTYSVSISNVSLDGTNSNNGLYITKRCGLGGFIGKMNLLKKVNVSITDSSIKNYTLTQRDTGSDKYIGGLIGVQTGDSTSSIILKNVLVSNCDFSLPDSGNYGGVIGHLRQPLTGYNVALENITLSNSTTSTWYKGDICGSIDKTPKLKVVGFSRQNTPTNTINNGTLHSDSYIIFSDYSGTGFDGTARTEQAIINGSANTTPAASVDINTPYANVNPAIELWSVTDHETILTGDGMGSSYNNLPIKSIKDDLAITTTAISYASGDEKTALTNRYNKRYSVVGTGITNNIAPENFTTFNTEWGTGTVTNDFAMLLIEDTNRTNTTKLINNYIQAITNQTKYSNFEADSPASGSSNLIYKVNLYRMQLKPVLDGEGNVLSYEYFEKKTDNVHLHRASSKFYMSSTDPNDVDSAELYPTFTLLDVAFYDPTVTSNQTVAYHLYIPIYVKKLLNYSFSIETAPNTPYYTDAYSDAMLMDNLGTPGSLYIKYTYERTKGEWQNALDYGENFLTNYHKILSMSQISDSGFDSNTLLVLVDMNQSDAVYYSRFSSAYTSGTPGQLTLYGANGSPFTKSIGSGTQFKPIDISDLLEIEVSSTKTDSTTSNHLNFVSLGSSSTNATVKIGNTYYRLYNDETDSEETTTYSLSVKNKAGLTGTLSDDDALHLEEKYYLSIFTRSNTTADYINRYNITFKADWRCFTR